MQPIQTITIPEPCHQQWQQMAAVNDGRYCDHCCKTVVDFSVMSNEEIVKHLSMQGNVCGRFGQRQLTGINDSMVKDTKRSLSWIGILTAAVISLTHPGKAEAKPTYNLEQGVNPLNKNKGDTPTDTTNLVTIKGTIVDERNEQLPGATLQLKGTQLSTITNADGYFELKNVPANGVMIAKFVGFQTMELSINSFYRSNGTIQLKMQPMIMGEVVVVKQPSIPRRVWHKIKHIF